MYISGGTTGYHPSFAPFSATEFREPLVRVRGYTEPRLTFAQHAAVILGVSAVTACLRRPILKLDSFYFLSDVPGECNRVYPLDKRAQFFRVLFGMRWFYGSSLFWNVSECVFFLSFFILLRDRLLWCGNTAGGFAAGSLTGVAYAVVRHPYDVLCTTAEMTVGLKKFKGPGDVLFTALRERPSVLFGIYKGIAAAGLGRLIQFGFQFGVYNATRHDAVYHHTLVLFLYCQFASFIGLLLQYPFMAVRHQLHLRNQFTRGRPHTYRSYLLDIRMRHGITKIFDGFFSTRPFLSAVPAALMMTLYDVCARRYTEYLHPALRKVHGEVDQTLVGANTPPPFCAKSLPAYEFKHK